MTDFERRPLESIFNSYVSGGLQAGAAADAIVAEMTARKAAGLPIEDLDGFLSRARSKLGASDINRVSLLFDELDRRAGRG